MYLLFNAVVDEWKVSFNLLYIFKASSQSIRVVWVGVERAGARQRGSYADKDACYLGGRAGA